MTTPMPEPKPLRRIASISILGESYDIAVNGTHYHLVEKKEPDAYQNPVFRQAEIGPWLIGISTRETLRTVLSGEAIALLQARGQALVDLLGEATQRIDQLTDDFSRRIQTLESELERAHAALQREAEPGSGRRPAGVVVRESGTGLSGVLEGERE